jgi:TM2 domain-containing membrane protein YozV
VRLEAGVSEADAALHGDHMGMAAVGWVAGCLVIWSSLFAIGKFLYGQTQTAVLLTGVFLVSGLTLLYVINHLWDARGQRAGKNPTPDQT